MNALKGHTTGLQITGSSGVPGSDEICCYAVQERYIVPILYPATSSFPLIGD